MMRPRNKENITPQVETQPTRDPRKLRNLHDRRQAAQTNWIAVVLAMVIIAGWIVAE